jgi:hypothetical protein
MFWEILKKFLRILAEVFGKLVKVLGDSCKGFSLEFSI